MRWLRSQYRQLKLRLKNYEITPEDKVILRMDTFELQAYAEKAIGKKVKFPRFNDLLNHEDLLRINSQINDTMTWVTRTKMNEYMRHAYMSVLMVASADVNDRIRWFENQKKKNDTQKLFPEPEI